MNLGLVSRVAGAIGVAVLCVRASAGPTEILAISAQGTMYSVDRETGLASLAPISPGLGGLFATSLTADDRQNFWVAATDFQARRRLVRFGPDGAQSLAITGLQAANPGVFSIDFTSDGRMMALVREGIALNSPFALYEIDTATGAATKTVDLTIEGGAATQIGDMAFDADGTLYAWHRSLISGPDYGLAIIDPETGIVTDAGGAVSFNANILAMDFAPGGELLGITSNAQPPSTILQASSLYGFNLGTGGPVLVGSLGEELDIRGVAVVPAPATAGLGLSLLALGPRRRWR